MCESGEHWRAELEATIPVAQGLRGELEVSNWVLHVEGWPSRTFSTFDDDVMHPRNITPIVQRFLTDIGLTMVMDRISRAPMADEATRDARS